MSLFFSGVLVIQDNVSDFPTVRCYNVFFDKKSIEVALQFQVQDHVLGKRLIIMS